MVQAAGGSGRSRTADLAAQEAARKAAEEAARKAAEEAARKAAEEAARKAAQEAARKAAAEKQETPHADKRQEAYKSAKTEPLSAETARLHQVTAAYDDPEAQAQSPSQTPGLDAAKARVAGHAEGAKDRIAEAEAKYPDASGDTKEKVAEIQKQATAESEKVLTVAAEEADKLIQQA